MYPPQVTNPYRFAQLYGDTTTNANTTNNFNRSCSTLGDANTAYFATDPNTHTTPLNRYSINNHHQQHGRLTNKANTLPHNLNDTSISSTLPGNYNYNQTFQSQSFYQQPQRVTSAGGSSSLNSPLPDSLLAIMNNDNQNYYAYKKQHYDQNITLCDQSLPVGGESNNKHNGPASMATPLNPFSAKVGKALYGLPFLSRSKSSLSFGATNAAPSADYYSDSNPNFYNKQTHRSNQASSKMMKASKI